MEIRRALVLIGRCNKTMQNFALHSLTYDRTKISNRECQSVLPIFMSQQISTESGFKRKNLFG